MTQLKNDKNSVPWLCRSDTHPGKHLDVRNGHAVALFFTSPKLPVLGGFAIFPYLYSLGYDRRGIGDGYDKSKNTIARNRFVLL